VEAGQPGFEPRERRRRALASAADLVREAESPRLLTWGWPEVQLPLFAKVTIRGEPGGGKSTSATAMAMRIAFETRTEVLYISAEEGTEATALERFGRVSVAMDIPVPQRLILSDARDIHEADEDIRAYERRLGGRGGIIVLDSLTQLRPAQSWWEDLIASSHGVIFVMHVTTGGHARGGREPEFAVDTNISIDDQGVALITKNRWGGTGAAFAFNARQPPRVTPRTAAGGPTACGGAQGGARGAGDAEPGGAGVAIEAEVIPFPRPKT
jgi:hypothetical protein